MATGDDETKALESCALTMNAADRAIDRIRDRSDSFGQSIANAIELLQSAVSDLFDAVEALAEERGRE